MLLFIFVLVAFSGSNGVHNVQSSNPATRTSWSSLETSDSSGIGSYISLNSQGRPHHDKTSGYHSDGQYDEDDQQSYDFDEQISMQMASLNPKCVQIPPNIQQNFRRNTDVSSSMRGTRSSGAPYRRSNSLTEGEPSMLDYRMNMPGRRSNTVYAKHPPSGAKPTAFQALASGQTAAQLRSQLSPTGSPVKCVRTPNRKVSSPPNLYGGSMQQKGGSVQNRPSVLGVSDSSNLYEGNNYGDVRSTSSMSGNVTTPVNEQDPYSTRNAIFQPQNDIGYVDRSTNQSNDYAVPTTQPYQVKPNSPVDFPPPPPAMLSQDPPQQNAFNQPQQQQQYQPPPSSQRSNPPQYQIYEELRKQQQLRDSQIQHSQYQPQNFTNQEQQYRSYQPQQQQQQQQQFPGQHFALQQQQQYQMSHHQAQQYQSSANQQQLQYPQTAHQWAPPQQPMKRRDSHSADDDMPEASPGSFLDKLQQKRMLVRSRTFSTGSNRSQSYGN